MSHVFSSFGTSFKYLWKDKATLLLSLVPIAIGIVLFSFLGKWLYVTGLEYGDIWIKKIVEGGSVWLTTLLKVILFVPLYFLISWTFVVVVSIIASPFNDAISSRVEKLAGGKTPESLKESLGRIVKNFLKMVINELKKLSLIFVLLIFSLLLNFIPILVPFSLAISGLLLAISFVDYSWSRHNYPFGRCLKDLKKNFVGYTLSGLIFMGLIATPLLNLLVLPFGVIYYTVIWSRNNPEISQIENEIL